MYRPTAAAKSARAFMQRAVAAGVSTITLAADALKGFMITSGLYEQAQRENRQYDRHAKRRRNWTRYAAHNETPGCNAAKRRLRQIERGSLREANGLVSS